MPRFSLPILAWVILGLAIVGLLPFLVTWYQIDRGRDGVVAQTQQTQKIIADTTAERIANRIGVLERLLRTAGDTEALYQDPNAAEAEQVLQQLFFADADLQALALLTYRSGQAQDVKSLWRSESPLEPVPLASPTPTAPPSIVVVEDRTLLVLQLETTRPKLSLLAVMDAAWLSDSLQPRGVDEGELALVDASGERIAGSAAALARIPLNQRQEMLIPTVRGGSSSFRTAEQPVVYGYAKVGELDWRVVSSQSADKAETATAVMRTTARNAFLLVTLVASLLSLAAWRFVVQPIRSIITRRDYVIDEDNPGSEIAQLQAVFERLERELEERDHVGDVFVDRYQILRRIGAGAMGTVYLAEDPKLQRPVAIKTIRLDRKLGTKQRQELVDSLLKEGVTGAGLTHPNVVTVYDVIGDEHGAFIAMEYVDGASLESLLDRQLRLPPPAVVAIARGVLRALQIAHDNGLVHRDVKPANILLGANGAVKLTDFGISAALAERNNKVMGTPGYLAPECYEHARYNAQTDLFALGVVLAEALTGQSIFAARKTQQIISRTKTREVVLPPDIVSATPESLRVLLRRLLDKQAENRPRDARVALDMLRELEVDDTILPALVRAPMATLPANAVQRRRLSNAPTAQVDNLGSDRDT